MRLVEKKENAIYFYFTREGKGLQVGGRLEAGVGRGDGDHGRVVRLVTARPVLDDRPRASAHAERAGVGLIREAPFRHRHVEVEVAVARRSKEGTRTHRVRDEATTPQLHHAVLRQAAIVRGHDVPADLPPPPTFFGDVDHDDVRGLERGVLQPADACLVALEDGHFLGRHRSRRGVRRRRRTDVPRGAGDGEAGEREADDPVHEGAPCTAVLRATAWI